MLKAIDLFAGVGGLKIDFHDTYADLVEEKILNSIMADCFDDTPAYALRGKIHANQQEYNYARHLADLDILNQFCYIFVRNHRNYKYSRGKADTVDHVVQILSQNGIFISIEKYNNWRRQKGYRHIDDESLELFLELLRITPSEFKRLIYAHVSARREIKKNTEESGLILICSPFSHLQKALFSQSKFVRPPCRQSA